MIILVSIAECSCLLMNNVESDVLGFVMPSRHSISVFRNDKGDCSASPLECHADVVRIARNRGKCGEDRPGMHNLFLS
jgi:hypothetical protein